MEKSLHYNQIVLNKPVYSEIDSRSQISTEVEFLGRQFKSPAIPANMKTAIDFDMAEKLSELGYFYILHRFYKYSAIENWCKRNQHLKNISISVGVKPRDYTLIRQLSYSETRIDYITIDIAFGHSKLMKDMIKYIKTALPNTKIIAGNVCTPEAVKDLVDWGADSCKIGLSMGKSCFLGSTKILTKTGLKEIKDIQVGDWVKTHLNRYKKIENKFENFSEDLIEVNGEICTSDHKFYVIDKLDIKFSDKYIEENGYWIEARNISIDKHFIIRLDR